MKLYLSILLCLLSLAATNASAQTYGNKNGTMHVVGALKIDSGMQIPTINMSQRWKNKYPTDTVAMLYRDSTTGVLMYMNMGVSTAVGSGGNVDTSTATVASGDFTGVTNTGQTIFTYVEPHSSSTYHTYSTGAYINLLTTGATVVNTYITYTNEAGNIETYQYCDGSFCGISAGDVVNYPAFYIRVKGGTTITASTTLTGGSTATYNVGAALQFVH